MYIFAYVSIGACVCVLNTSTGAETSSATGRLPILRYLPLARRVIKQENTRDVCASLHTCQVGISNASPGRRGGEAAEDAGAQAPYTHTHTPFPAHSTCPASQGLRGVGGKGGPEVKGLSMAGLGLWQPVFRSAFPVSEGATRPEGGLRAGARRTRRLPWVCSTQPERDDLGSSGWDGPPRA